MKKENIQHVAIKLYARDAVSFLAEIYCNKHCEWFVSELKNKQVKPLT